MGEAVVTGKLKGVLLLAIGLSLLWLHRYLSKLIGTPTASAPLAKTRAALSSSGKLAQQGQKLRRRRPVVGDMLA